MINVRKATDTDWAAIWPIVQEVAAAGETYALPAELTETYARDMWIELPPGNTVVAVDEDGTVLGSAHMGPNRPGNGDHIATAGFMVGSAARGRGVGRALGEYVVEWLRGEGFSRHTVQRRRRVEHGRRETVEVVGVHRDRHRAGSVSAPE